MYTFLTDPIPFAAYMVTDYHCNRTNDMIEITGMPPHTMLLS